MWSLCIWGVRVRWHTESDGEFFCPGCGGDRGYRKRGGVRKLTVLGVSLLSRGTVGSVVECAACRTRYGLAVLERPTSTRLSVMLHDAMYTVALAVLTAGGADDLRVREAATLVVRDSGGTDCSEDQLAEMVAAMASLTGDHADDSVDGCGSWLSIELHEALEPLAEHLTSQGGAHILRQGAKIALADGSYLPRERAVLAAIGRCLLMSEAATARVLQAALR